MEKTSTLLVNSSITAQVGGIEGEVNPVDGTDNHKEKMAEVAVVLKSFMHKSGRQSKKNNGDNKEE